MYRRPMTKKMSKIFCSLGHTKTRAVTGDSEARLIKILDAVRKTKLWKTIMYN
jgi:hypothetical protein